MQKGSIPQLILMFFFSSNIYGPDFGLGSGYQKLLVKGIASLVFVSALLEQKKTLFYSLQVKKLKAPLSLSLSLAILILEREKRAIGELLEFGSKREEENEQHRHRLRFVSDDLLSRRSRFPDRVRCQGCRQ